MKSLGDLSIVYHVRANEQERLAKMVNDLPIRVSSNNCLEPDTLDISSANVGFEARPSKHKVSYHDLEKINKRRYELSAQMYENGARLGIRRKKDSLWLFLYFQPAQPEKRPE